MKSIFGFLVLAFLGLLVAVLAWRPAPESPRPMLPVPSEPATFALPPVVPVPASVFPVPHSPLEAIVPSVSVAESVPVAIVIPLPSDPPPEDHGPATGALKEIESRLRTKTAAEEPGSPLPQTRPQPEFLPTEPDFQEDVHHGVIFSVKDKGVELERKGLMKFLHPR